MARPTNVLERLQIVINTIEENAPDVKFSVGKIKHIDPELYYHLKSSLLKQQTLNNGNQEK